MAPKRKVVGSVVRKRTTKKFVKETVEVALVENNSEQQLTQEEVNRETEETEEQEEEVYPSTKKPSRVIVVEYPKAKTDEQHEIDQMVTTPPEEVLEDQVPTEKDEVQEEVMKDQIQKRDNEEEEEVTKDQIQERDNEEEEEVTKDQIQERDNEEEEEAKAKTETKGKKRGRKKRARRMEIGKSEGYKRYIHRVLKQVHPELGISSNAITVLDGFMKDMFERLAGEATSLAKYTEKMTLSSREFQGAVRLVLPGELGKHAVAEGTKAVANYMSYDVGGATNKS